MARYRFTTRTADDNERCHQVVRRCASSMARRSRQRCGLRPGQVAPGCHPMVRRRRRCVSRAICVPTGTRRARTWVSANGSTASTSAVTALTPWSSSNTRARAPHGRTYLPMPFAHVLGGDGWGFHVRTRRRVWFDVGASDAHRCGWRSKLGGSRAAEELDVAFYDGSPVEVLNAFLDDTGEPTELPSGCSGCGRAATSGTRRHGSLSEMDRHSRTRHPRRRRRHRGVERRVDVHRVPRCPYEVNADGAPHRARRFHVSGRRGVARPEGHGRRIPRARREDPAVADSAAKDAPSIQAGRRTPTRPRMIEATAMSSTRGRRARPYRNRGWWFPHALHARLH